MTYQETLDYLYSALPMFQRIGAAAFKKDLTPTIRICEYLENPQNKFLSVHVAGTNGKGSTSHALAAILQKSGYKVGLYTSPHLKSFRERIKINGECIPEEAVVTFVSQHRKFLEELKPSFFEMTVALAFAHFAKEQVDVAVVEVGMGGRFDSTNVITPVIGLITNIGMDHTQFLGETLEAIAFEKAGIIKPSIPVIIGEALPETKKVFHKVAKDRNAPIFYAEEWVKAKVSEDLKLVGSGPYQGYTLNYRGKEIEIQVDLLGHYQVRNLPAIYLACMHLKSMGWNIEEGHVLAGLRDIVRITGLKGRWQVLRDSPMVICDTGHNKEAVALLMKQLALIPHERLYLVWGMVNDKDVSGVLSLLPKEAKYVFCQAAIPRAMPAESLGELAGKYGLKGECIKNVNEALAHVLKNATKNDLVFIGGSTFVVAEIEEL
ncbi:bifunctional folylpolyglutamate synthase/dihydrofolate synthase [Pleomorphovibrio marinus]|uniref:bifunctional folylpolyglutamate synthase/dihydrofolate synthase n=1 Tax=Pleomorphovibrio marinus TaxID=2164132 RepID=UPI000E0A45B1|nr:folylpolyglutamate synthase/dihydrofolate synthase family protein [Pleomorphovibrio marinus]